MRKLLSVVRASRPRRWLRHLSPEGALPSQWVFRVRWALATLPLFGFLMLFSSWALIFFLLDPHF